MNRLRQLYMYIQVEDNSQLGLLSEIFECLKCIVGPSQPHTQFPGPQETDWAGKTGTLSLRPDLHISLQQTHTEHQNTSLQ